MVLAAAAEVEVVVERTSARGHRGGAPRERSGRWRRLERISSKTMLPPAPCPWRPPSFCGWSSQRRGEESKRVRGDSRG